MAFDHQRIQTLEPLVARPPANKKIKLVNNSACEATPPQPLQLLPNHQPLHQHANGFASEGQPGAGVDNKGVQTAAIPLAESARSTASDRTPSLESIRSTISEQFDIEIVLKHKELANIEKEIARTQIAMEQLRRCHLLPYHESFEAQIHASLNYTPPTANPYNIPDYAPPPEGVVDGPYTRHYRDWLLQHQKFDGPNAPAYQLPAPQTPLDLHQSLSTSGRPQRTSAMKVQMKNGEQVCLFRKRDGVLVRLECGDCHRSNFSSAQGFINHCRIAHQTEYASHDAAAEACGKEVNEELQAAMVSPLFRTAVDGPARNTRQTNSSHKLPTPPGSFSGPSNPFPPRLPQPTPTAARKNGRRSAISVNTPKPGAPAGPVGLAAKGNPISPTDLPTTNLESHLKRKRPDINVTGLLKEVSETRAAFPTGMSDSEEDTISDNILSLDPRKPPHRTPMGAHPLTPQSSKPISRRPAVSNRAIQPKKEPDTEMPDVDAFSSDEDDGGYRSDGNGDLYSQRGISGQNMQYQHNGFGGMNTNMATGLMTPASVPMSGFSPSLLERSNGMSPNRLGAHNALGSMDTSPMVMDPNSMDLNSHTLNSHSLGSLAGSPTLGQETINPAMLMMGGGATGLNMVNMTAALMAEDGMWRGRERV
ncbi:Similar to Protein AHC1; acc. no. Q12433 [Pyronema omphalodes CBS 100304]|uniref:Similar to Protein AHC1 acc. no. Q12433 n=1 Tax=Pyronema omphalodes (strain CBS 100304) TaxID=1076935 RepID=U4KZF5_PYROM|nr:Similar to Protein AHC1; acc. no. Q12433 [Pyronema omphalodes CBS 100304]